MDWISRYSPGVASGQEEDNWKPISFDFRAINSLLCLQYSVYYLWEMNLTAAPPVSAIHVLCLKRALKHQHCQRSKQTNRWGRTKAQPPHQVALFNFKRGEKGIPSQFNDCFCTKGIFRDAAEVARVLRRKGN